jgi:hypothetical protein
MRQFEQDWLEVGGRVARSLHYQHPRNLRLLQATQAKARRTALGAQERPRPEDDQCPRTRATRPRPPEEVMPTAKSSSP